MALLHEEDDHNHEDKKSSKRTERRHSLEPEKAYLTGKLVIVTKFCDHVLHRLASSLLNVVRQIDW